jgi:type IV secretory pathway VirB10-like protein
MKLAAYFRLALFSLGPFTPIFAFAQAGPPGCTDVSRQDALPSQCVQPVPEASDTKRAASIVELKLPSGTPLRLALDERVRIKTRGQTVHAKLIDSVYAFDQVVIPAGSLVTGRVESIDPVPKVQQIQSYLNGNFTPPHPYRIAFDSVTLPDGATRQLATTVSAGTAETVHLVANPERQAEKKKKNPAARAAGEAKQETEAKVHSAIQEIKAPGKMHRLKEMVLSQSPYRRQYLQPGTRFTAVLNEPLDFGKTSRTQEQLAQLGGAPSAESLFHARLVQEVSSANAGRGTAVAAVLTEPVYSEDHHLLLPVESRIEGEVVQVKRAHKLHHNGELRVVFNRIETPEGVVQPMQGSLEGLEADRAAGLKLDEEGGARATDSKTRYLSTGFALLMTAAAARPDVEHGTTDAAGDPGVRAGAGISGYGFAGSLITLATRSQPVSIGFAAYGASFSVYHNFLSRGKEVVFVKDTPMEIGFAPPHGEPPRTN